MSAWDVAGAVVWTMVAGLLGTFTAWSFPAVNAIGLDEHRKAWLYVAVLATASLGGSAFCIARLCGAHA